MVIKFNPLYIPCRGDLVWLDFDPQAGHEQAGKRPAIVLSRESYNKRSGLVLVCPVTSRIKGYPFEISLDGYSASIHGAVLADQIGSYDWRARHATFIESVDPTLCEKTMQLVTGLTS